MRWHHQCFATSGGPPWLVCPWWPTCDFEVPCPANLRNFWQVSIKALNRLICHRCILSIATIPITKVGFLVTHLAAYIPILISSMVEVPCKRHVILPGNLSCAAKDSSIELPLQGFPTLGVGIASIFTFGVWMCLAITCHNHPIFENPINSYVFLHYMLIMLLTPLLLVVWPYISWLVRNPHSYYVVSLLNKSHYYALIML
jgi:hypothetical protein